MTAMHVNIHICSGLVKPKKYDWKDSNLALFGSDTDKEVKSEHFLLLIKFCFIHILLPN